MKKTILALLLMLSTFNFNNFAADKDGHALTALWDSYRKAEQDDLPKKQLSILESIKKEASKQKLAWDYYDACERYVQVRRSTNWKLADEARANFAKEVRDFNHPTLTFFYNAFHEGTNASPAERLKSIEAVKEELQSSYFPQFYSHDSRLGGFKFREALCKLLPSDYDYALWALFGEHVDDGSLLKAMEERYRDAYPYNALVEYSRISSAIYADDSARAQAFKKFAAEYSSRAAGALAEEDLLLMRFDSLLNANASAKDFLALDEDCTALSRRLGDFRGDEKTIALCCTAADGLHRRLNDRSISMEVEDGTAVLLLRNVPSARVSIKSGRKALYTEEISNPAKSFFVIDTVKVKLRDLDDGEYMLAASCGKLSEQTSYSKHSLSIASRRNSGGLGVYITDSRSGKPVESCTLTLLNNSGKTVASAENFRLKDGYTPVPEKFEKAMSPDRWGYTIRASLVEGSGRTRSSREVSVRAEVKDNTPAAEKVKIERAVVLTDRKAFNQGEIVKFKVILFDESFGGDGEDARTVREEAAVDAIFSDADGKRVADLHLTTGEFGSAAGEFKIPAGAKGGRYHIEIRNAGKHVTGTNITVDEFTAPTFDLAWEVDGRFYLPEDEIIVKGRIRSWSGHSLGSATASYAVRDENRGKTLAEGELELAGDGSFSIPFRAGKEDYSYPSINVKVTDGTGETLEFTTSRMVRRHIPFGYTVKNADKGRFDAPDKADFSRRWAYDRSRGTIVGKASVCLEPEDKCLIPSAKCEYELLDGKGAVVLKGETEGYVGIQLDLGSLPAGRYRLHSKLTAKSSSGKDYVEEAENSFLYVPEDAASLVDGLQSFFREMPGDSLQFGSSTGEVWAVVEFYRDGNILAAKDTVHFDGNGGEQSSLRTIGFPEGFDTCRDRSIAVLWFKDKDVFSYVMELSAKAEEKDEMPLRFTRFLDTTAPGKEYEFLIASAPGTELAAAIFDASADVFQPNVWNAVRRAPRPASARVERDDAPGVDGGFFYDASPILYAKANARMSAMSDLMLYESVSVRGYAEEVAEEDSEEGESPAYGGQEAYVRQDFSKTVAWEPFLRTDENGETSLRFRNADKLSTYHVQLFAHDRNLRNAALRRDMVVTLPVKIAVVEPSKLYEGDRYVARVTVSNSSDRDIEAVVKIQFLDGGDYRSAGVLKSGEEPMSIPAGGVRTFDCAAAVPATGTLGILCSVSPAGGESGNDAVFVAVPVERPVQTLREAHSALLLSGHDKAAAVDSLRSCFVNVPEDGLKVSEISIKDMLLEAIPERVEPKGDNIVALSEALYASYLSGKLLGKAPEMSGEAVGKIVKCANEDGGFGWYAGMRSSATVTAVALERFARMEGECPEEIRTLIPAAVRFLDKEFFSRGEWPLWCGRLSLEQYLLVRSLFPEVSLETKDADPKTVKEFRKAASAYLVPTGARGLNGMVFAKSRRMLTLSNLLASDKGRKLASSFGVKFRSAARLRRSLDKDVASLAEYAEPHSSGGVYFPNAVLPWRGLLESEAYAHATICRLLDGHGRSDLAEGVRLWIMVQKETQEWTSDPAYIEAIAEVMKGTEETLSTKVIAVEGEATLPFEDIAAAGNGFSVSREYWRDGKLLEDGDTLRVGEKIEAVYRIRNDENRSFVRLTAPRSAVLRPAEQLSGLYGLKAKTLGASWMGFVPQGYRSVYGDRSVFDFDSWPEEETTVSETLFVVQEGVFSSPAVSIESLYATHYRANDKGRQPQTAVR